MDQQAPSLRELESLTDEQKRIISLTLELKSYNRLKIYMDADYSRIAEEKKKLHDRIDHIETEINLLSQGQLDL